MTATEVYGDDDSFSYLDYTPVTAKRPVKMTDQLRVASSAHKTKIALCITCYNEDADELHRTLEGIAANLTALEDGDHVTWNEIVVFVVFDGVRKMHKSMKEYAEESLLIFDPNMLCTDVDGQKVNMHLFERTVLLQRHEAQDTYFKPLQLVFAIKQHNGGKLNSHLWYFSGFCRQLQPEFCVLVDVGTVPRDDAIQKVYHSFKQNPQVGGICGEIAVRAPKVWSIIESAQHFEYKMSHLMDKAMESVFGFISVLPGAFCAYRWVAVRGEPLARYFMLEEHSTAEIGPFIANMYLAEDRVLGFEVVLKRNMDWTLHYRAGAVADTDAPQGLVELIKQRRRWLNGSFFALVYYIGNFSAALRRSDHGWGRKLIFTVQLAYQVLSLMLNWLAVGTMFISFKLVCESGLTGFQSADTITFLFLMVYAGILIVQVVLGLTTKPQSSANLYVMCAAVWAMLMTIVISLGVWQLATGEYPVELIYAAIGSFAAYGFCALLYGELFTILVVLPQYMIMVPTFINTFTIYSFCNMHDISWGTKESQSVNQLEDEKADRAVLTIMENTHQGFASQNPIAQKFAKKVLLKTMERIRKREAETRKKAAIRLAQEKAQMAAEFNVFRTRMMTAWALSNVAFVAVVFEYDLIGHFAYYTAGCVVITLVYRVLGTTWYQLERVFKGLTRLLCRTRVRFTFLASRKRLKRRDNMLKYSVNAFASAASPTNSGAGGGGGGGEPGEVVVPMPVAAGGGNEMGGAPRGMATTEAEHLGAPRQTTRNRVIRSLKGPAIRAKLIAAGVVKSSGGSASDPLAQGTGVAAAMRARKAAEANPVYETADPTLAQRLTFAHAAKGARKIGASSKMSLAKATKAATLVQLVASPRAGARAGGAAARTKPSGREPVRHKVSPAHAMRRAQTAKVLAAFGGGKSRAAAPGGPARSKSSAMLSVVSTLGYQTQQNEQGGGDLSDSSSGSGSASSSSGASYMGVEYDSGDGMYYAVIEDDQYLGDGGLVTLGAYESAREAAKVYDAAARIRFGPHAETNFEASLFDPLPTFGAKRKGRGKVTDEGDGAGSVGAGVEAADSGEADREGKGIDGSAVPAGPAGVALGRVSSRLASDVAAVGAIVSEAHHAARVARKFTPANTRYAGFSESDSDVEEYASDDDVSGTRQHVHAFAKALVGTYIASARHRAGVLAALMDTRSIMSPRAADRRLKGGGAGKRAAVVDVVGDQLLAVADSMGIPTAGHGRAPSGSSSSSSSSDDEGAGGRDESGAGGAGEDDGVDSPRLRIKKELSQDARALAQKLMPSSSDSSSGGSSDSSDSSSGSDSDEPGVRSRKRDAKYRGAVKAAIRKVKRKAAREVQGGGAGLTSAAGGGSSGKGSRGGSGGTRASGDSAALSRWRAASDSRRRMSRARNVASAFGGDGRPRRRGADADVIQEEAGDCRVQ